MVCRFLRLYLRVNEAGRSAYLYAARESEVRGSMHDVSRFIVPVFKSECAAKETCCVSKRQS